MKYEVLKEVVLKLRQLPGDIIELTEEQASAYAEYLTLIPAKKNEDGLVGSDT